MRLRPEHLRNTSAQVFVAPVVRFLLMWELGSCGSWILVGAGFLWEPGIHDGLKTANVPSAWWPCGLLLKRGTAVAGEFFGQGFLT